MAHSDNKRNLSTGRRTKKILAALLALLCLCACLASCATSDSDTPQGMKIASADGADFKLFVPTTWNLNTAYGISGAYYNLATQSNVSAVRYEVGTYVTEEEKPDTDAFFEARLRPGDVSVGETVDDATLGSLNAKEYRYGRKICGNEYKIRQVVGNTSTHFYVVTFTMTETLFDLLGDDMEKILSEFRTEPYEASEYAREPDPEVEAPEGMQVVSDAGVAYEFFAPADWKVDRSLSICATYREEDRASVSVVPYMPKGGEDDITPSGYFEKSVELMNETGTGYTLLDETERKLGDASAKVYHYQWTVGGNAYEYMQVIARYRGMIYIVTYTATPSTYAAHLDDLSAMLDAFRFR